MPEERIPSSSSEKKSQNLKTPSETSLAAAVENMQQVGRILDLGITVNVNIGTLKMSLKSVLELAPGAIIELQKNVDGPLSLTVNNKKDIAIGEVVTVGESLGLRVTQIL